VLSPAWAGVSASWPWAPSDLGCLARRWLISKDRHYALARQQETKVLAGSTSLAVSRGRKMLGRNLLLNLVPQTGVCPASVCRQSPQGLPQLLFLWDRAQDKCFKTERRVGALGDLPKQCRYLRCCSGPSRMLLCTFRHLRT